MDLKKITPQRTHAQCAGPLRARNGPKSPEKRNTWIGSIYFLCTASCPFNSVPLQSLNTLSNVKIWDACMLGKPEISGMHFSRATFYKVQM